MRDMWQVMDALCLGFRGSCFDVVIDKGEEGRGVWGRVASLVIARTPPLCRAPGIYVLNMRGRPPKNGDGMGFSLSPRPSSISSPGSSCLNYTCSIHDFWDCG